MIHIFVLLQKPGNLIFNNTTEIKYVTFFYKCVRLCEGWRGEHMHLCTYIKKTVQDIMGYKYPVTKHALRLISKTDSKTIFLQNTDLLHLILCIIN